MVGHFPAVVTRRPTTPALIVVVARKFHSQYTNPTLLWNFCEGSRSTNALLPYKYHSFAVSVIDRASSVISEFSQLAMGSSQQQQLDKMKQRQNYRNVWHTDLLRSLAADCPYFSFALFCAPCASYLLRKRALYNDMSRYVCCAGYMPCSGSCGESKCPELCLCTEVFLCFPNSVASTRFLLQDEFNIQTTKCDNCIIGFMFCLQQVACIFSIVACITGSDEIEQAANILSCLSDFVYCTVCACMQTQHKVEMDKRDGKFGPVSAMQAPPLQQMSRIDVGVPPPVGYAPSYPPPAQPPYGQPPYGQPPYQQQPYGYPPQAYPAQGYPSAYPPPDHYPKP